MERVIHTPEGVRDIYGGECARKRVLLKKLHKVFVSYGYEDIETPTFEYFDVFSRKIGTIPSKDLYKFSNQREVMKIQDEFFRVYESKDLQKLERFHRQLDIISEGYRAQAITKEFMA